MEPIWMPDEEYIEFGSTEPVPASDPAPPSVPPEVAAVDDAIAVGASTPWKPGERDEMVAAYQRLSDRHAAALSAARVSGNLGEADAILATMTRDELCDLVAAMTRLKPRAMSLIIGERKGARRRT
jgi:hypothetical protein